jgi:hypothetical protein
MLEVRVFACTPGLLRLGFWRHCEVAWVEVFLAILTDLFFLYLIAKRGANGYIKIRPNPRGRADLAWVLELAPCWGKPRAR